MDFAGGAALANEHKFAAHPGYNSFHLYLKSGRHWVPEWVVMHIFRGANMNIYVVLGVCVWGWLQKDLQYLCKTESQTVITNIKCLSFKCAYKRNILITFNWSDNIFSSLIYFEYLINPCVDIISYPFVVLSANCFLKPFL